jgi:hypothetical protein
MELYNPETPPNQENQNPQPATPYSPQNSGQVSYPAQQPLPQEQAHTFPPPQGIPQPPAYQTVPPPQGMPQSPAYPMDASAFNGTAPVLQTWKTSVGFSVLGLLAGLIGIPLVCNFFAIPFIYLTAFLSQNIAFGDFIGHCVVVALGLLITIIYALRFYPSYFGDKPLLKSNKAISFANFAFGIWAPIPLTGVLFAVFRNRNLTKGNKGVSHIVCTVLCTVALVFTPIQLYRPYDVRTGYGPPAFTFDNTDAAWPENPEASSSPAYAFTDAETGASFKVPDDWTEEPASPDLIFTKANFYPPNNGETSSVTVSYASSDDWSQMTEAERQGLTRQDYNNDFVSQEFLEYLEGHFGDGAFADAPGVSVFHEGTSGRSIPGENVQIEETVIGEVDFFKVSSTGTMVTDGQEAGFQYVYLVHFENGYMYAFDYSEVGESRHYPEFESIVGSAIYPAG